MFNFISIQEARTLYPQSKYAYKFLNADDSTTVEFYLDNSIYTIIKDNVMVIESSELQFCSRMNSVLEDEDFESTILKLNSYND